MTLLIRKSEATEAKPTPGPWQASQCDDGLWMVHTEGEIVALSDANTRGEPMHEPNARLMAAAPDMLAALQAVETWWLEAGMKEATGAPYAIFAARAAINKARGTLLANNRAGD